MLLHLLSAISRQPQTTAYTEHTTPVAHSSSTYPNITHHDESVNTCNMLNFQRLIGGLNMFLLLSSSAASWSITFYETMDDCICTKGPCRQTYLSYEGSNGRSGCFGTGNSAPNADCSYTTDGGATFRACDHYMRMGAFAIGPETQCDWGHVCKGSGHVVQNGEGRCFNTSAYEAEVLDFSCAGSSDPPQVRGSLDLKTLHVHFSLLYAPTSCSLL